MSEEFVQKERLPEAKGIEEAVRIVRESNEEVKAVIDKAVGVREEGKC